MNTFHTSSITRSVLLLGLFSVVAGRRALAEEIVVDVNTTIDVGSPLIGADLRVVDGANPPTVLDVLASFGGQIDIHDSSIVNVRSGSFLSTSVFDHGTINLFDGIVDDDLNVFGFGTANVFADGVVDEKLKVYGSSTVNIFGGIMEGLFTLSSEGTNTSTVNVSGGNIGEGIFTGNSKVTISGGETIGFTARDNSTIEIRGGLFVSSSFSSLVGDSAVVNIFGRDLEFNDGVLTGFLLDGTPISHEFQITDSAQVNLINVPEPASITLMLLAVSICVLLKRRSWTGRRRSSTGAF